MKTKTIAYPNLWDAAKAEFRRKFIALNTCMKGKDVLQFTSN